MSAVNNAKRAAARRERDAWVVEEHHHFSEYFGMANAAIAERLGVELIRLERVLRSARRDAA